MNLSERNRQVLDDALTGLGPFTAVEQRTIDWLVRWEPETVDALASLLGKARTAGPVPRPRPPSTWTCVYRYCDGACFTGSPDDAAEWMDEHVANQPHDPRWPVSFRIDRPGAGLPDVDYRDARMLLGQG